MQTILLIEDEQKIARFIELELTHEGYTVIKAEDGRTGLELAEKGGWDLLLLDIMLPGLNGLEVLRRLRKQSDLPVIMLTARDAVMDKVTGLDMGADDYITKPFEPKELLARVKAVLRRGAPEEESGGDILAFPGLTINLTSYEVIYDGSAVQMPPKELELLHFLAKHQNHVFTREQLLEKVWGFDYFGDSRTVDVHVKRLREKLPQSEKHGWLIRTIWSVGYKFEVKQA